MSRFLPIPVELIPKVVTAYRMGISAKVIARALHLKCNPHNLAQLCYRNQDVPACDDFRVAFEALFKP